MLEWLDPDLAVSIARYGYVTLLGGAVLALLIGGVSAHPLRHRAFAHACVLAVLALLPPLLPLVTEVLMDETLAGINVGALIFQWVPPVLVLASAGGGSLWLSGGSGSIPRVGHVPPRRQRRAQPAASVPAREVATAPTPLRDTAGWIADPIIPDSSAWPTLDAVTTPVPVENGDHPRRRVVAVTGAGIAVIAGAVGALALERRRRNG